MSTDTEMASNIVKTVGRQVRRHRRLAGMTQEALAERSGIYRTYLSRVEHGTANPTLLVLDALAATLKVELRELVCE